MVPFTGDRKAGEEEARPVRCGVGGLVWIVLTVVPWRAEGGGVAGGGFVGGRDALTVFD